MKKILLLLFLVACVVLRPTQIEQKAMFYGGVGSDDLCYTAHATAIVYGQWPSYAKETICNSQLPMASIGPALLGLPFVFLGSLVDRVEKNPVVDVRTEADTVDSATAWGFIGASLFYFAFSLLLLQRWLYEWKIPARYADWAIIFMVILQGAPLFVYRRPVFSHSYELFTCVAFLTYLQKIFSHDSAKAKQLFFAGFLGALLGLVRYNNVPLALAWPLPFLFLSASGTFVWNKKKIFHYTGILGSFAFFFILLKVIPTYLDGNERYSGLVKGLLVPPTPSYLLLRVTHFFVGKDWGLLFSAPFLLLGLFALCLQKFPEKRKAVLLALPLLVNFYVCLVFGSNGGWYGYRYMIFSAFPIFIVPLAHFLERGESILGKKLLPLCFLLAVLPAMSMFLFEGNATNLTLLPVQLDGRIDWGHPTYQWEVWKTVVHAPKEVVFILFKGVPAYFAYVVAKLVGLSTHLPALIVTKFTDSGWLLFFKTILMLAVPPLTMVGLSKYFLPRESEHR